MAKPTSVVFTGDKELTGKINNTLEGDEFQFELYNSNAGWNLGALKETVSNQAGGAFEFTKINFETANDRYFIVKEKNAGQNINGVTYDATEFRVHVQVVDDLKGQLHTVVNIYDGNNVPQDSIQFTNIYEVTGTDSVILSGEAPLAATNDAAGNFEIEILAETAGTYYFVVCEDTSVSARLVTFDRTVFWVSVEVEDVDGVLVAHEPVGKSDGSERYCCCSFAGL